MIEVKQSQSVIVPVALFDSTTKNARTGVASGSVTATVRKSDASTQSVTVNGSTWVEESAGAFSGSGTYFLTLSSGNTDTAGPLVVSVSATGADIARVAVNVVVNFEADTYTRIGSPVSGTVSGDIATRLASTDSRLNNLDATISSRLASADSRLNNLDATISSREPSADVRLAYLDASISSRADSASVTAALGPILADVERLLDHAEGRWKIFVTGPDANKMVIYDRLGAVLKKFDLEDSNGDPTSISPFDRIPE